jgi:hypothetical protein
MTPSLDDLNLDLRDLLRALVDAEVEFVVVEANALSFHDAPRASGDMDIFVRPSPANAARVWCALLALGAPVSAGPPANLPSWKAEPSTSSAATCYCATSSPPVARRIWPTPLD